ncbi:MAG: signal recognition particle-docking protein FtsY [Salinarimonas sp.]|nr:signal recognition particle-docking protein FtsY [Salinarimonas sp.]
MSDEGENRGGEKRGLWSRLFGKEVPKEAPKEAPEQAPQEQVRQEAPQDASDEQVPEHDAPAEGAAQDQRPPEHEARQEPAREPVAPEPEPEPAPVKRSWWKRLTEGLSRTSSSIGAGITGIFTKRKLDAQTLEELEDVLVQADLGVAAAMRITESIGEGRFDKEIAPEEVKRILAAEVEKVLVPVAKPLVIDTAHKPFVILMVGVNGAGKTTTIGKLASKFAAEGKSVMLAAGDTFRAAAIEQLRIWGERTGAPVLSRDQGADAAGLAYDALTQARAEGRDVLLVDTAGRLQNKTALMAELEKIIRVMRKLDESAPHAVLLVLDATVGQNALSQVEIFGKAAGVTGLVMTKLDGTARGGILVALADKFGLPVHYIGVGEGVEDLEPFAARDFAQAIAGIAQDRS